MKKRKQLPEEKRRMWISLRASTEGHIKLTAKQLLEEKKLQTDSNESLLYSKQKIYALQKIHDSIIHADDHKNTCSTTSADSFVAKFNVYFGDKIK